MFAWNSKKRGCKLIDIFLCGDPNDTSVSSVLVPALSRCGGVRFQSAERIYGMGETPDFLIYDCVKIPKIELKNGIVIFKNSFCSQGSARLPSGFLCVLETKNTRAAQFLEGTDAAVVTCGTGPRDTLSVAGLEGASATLSLQRNLEPLCGGVLEPHDFTVKLMAKRSPHQILSVCAILLISGADSSKGYVV